VESITSIVVLVALILFPVVEGVYLVLNFEDLDDEDFEQRHGEFYKDLRLDRGTQVLWQPIWFLLRRLILGVTVIFIKERLVFQVLVFSMSVIIQLNILRGSPF